MSTPGDAFSGRSGGSGGGVSPGSRRAVRGVRLAGGAGTSLGETASFFVKPVAVSTSRGRLAAVGGGASAFLLEVRIQHLN